LTILASVLAIAAFGSAGLSPASAQSIRSTDTLTYAGAKMIIAGCEAMALKEDWSVGLWVLDSAGRPIAAAAVNDASEIGMSTARLKAETALRVGMPSEDWSRFLETPSGQRTSDQLGLFTAPGGLPVIANGKVVGAVGAGGIMPANGVSLDRKCVQAGIDALNLPAR